MKCWTLTLEKPAAGNAMVSSRGGKIFFSQSEIYNLQFKQIHLMINGGRPHGKAAAGNGFFDNAKKSGLIQSF